MTCRLLLTKSIFESDLDFEFHDGTEELMDLLHGTGWEGLFDDWEWDDCGEDCDALRKPALYH